MDTEFVNGAGGMARRDVRVRVVSMFAALALVLAAFVLIQQPAGASPAQAPVAAAVAGASAVRSVAPQIDFGNFICGLLESLFAAFASSPFFAFIVPFLNALLVSFGCVISGG